MGVVIANPSFFIFIDLSNKQERAYMLLRIILLTSKAHYFILNLIAIIYQGEWSGIEKIWKVKKNVTVKSTNRITTEWTSTINWRPDENKRHYVKWRRAALYTDDVFWKKTCSGLNNTRFAIQPIGMAKSLNGRDLSHLNLTIYCLSIVPKGRCVIFSWLFFKETQASSDDK